MKIIRQTLLFLILVISTPLLVRAQQPEYMATIYIKDVVRIKPNIMEFELIMIRESDKWEYWANGSFEFTLDSAGFDINPQDVSIEYISNTSDLDLRPITGQLPKDNYLLTARVFKGRISITIAGPENYQNTVKVGLDTIGIRIGKFRIIGKENTLLPSTVKWLEPAYYYQACAFKLLSDSLIKPSVNINYIDDNIEMNYNAKQIVSYKSESAPGFNTEIINFNAIYVGSKRVRLSWETPSESSVKGWIISRTLRDFEKNTKIEDLLYLDTIADFRLNVPPHADLIGIGTKKPGRYYEFNFDTVPFRGVQYCYELMYEDLDGIIHSKLAFDCEPIPNAVITFAQNNPNPFTDKTIISYTVDDDVYLTAEVYDLQGKLVETLLDNRFTKLGHYGGENGIVWSVPEFAQQGIYNILLVAYPINDKSIDISKAIIKAQLIK